MLAAAAHAVSELVDSSAPGAALLPRVEALRETSVAVAAAVAEAAAADGVAGARLSGDVRGQVHALMCGSPSTSRSGPPELPGGGGGGGDDPPGPPRVLSRARLPIPLMASAPAVAANPVPGSG